MHVFSGISVQHTVSTLCNSLHTHIYSIIQYNARPNIYTSWSVSRKEDAVYYVFLTEKSTLNSRALHQASKLKIKKNKSFVSCLNSVTSEGQWALKSVWGAAVCAFPGPVFYWWSILPPYHAGCPGFPQIIIAAKSGVEEYSCGTTSPLCLVTTHHFKWHLDLLHPVHFFSETLHLCENTTSICSVNVNK